MAFVSSFSGLAISAPARNAVSTRPVTVRVSKSTRMSLAPMVQTIAFKSTDAATLIAGREADFGGYAGPIVGLLIIGVIIAVLTPPVKE